jgi:hypothetical protein
MYAAVALVGTALANGTHITMPRAISRIKPILNIVFSFLSIIYLSPQFSMEALLLRFTFKVLQLTRKTWQLNIIIQNMNKIATSLSHYTDFHQKISIFNK